MSVCPFVKANGVLYEPPYKNCDIDVTNFGARYSYMSGIPFNPAGSVRRPSKIICRMDYETGQYIYENEKLSFYFPIEEENDGSLNPQYLPAGQYVNFRYVQPNDVAYLLTPKQIKNGIVKLGYICTEMPSTDYPTGKWKDWTILEQEALGDLEEALDIILEIQQNLINKNQNSGGEE